MVETPIRVAVVDDHEMVREGLRVLLETAPDIETVGEAGTVGRAISMLKEVRPDVALIDLQLPDGSGIDICRAVTGGPSRVRCVILTSVSHDEAVLQAVAAGASGFVLKQIRGPELLASIRKVAAGESLLDRRPADPSQIRSGSDHFRFGQVGPTSRPRPGSLPGAVSSQSEPGGRRVR